MAFQINFIRSLYEILKRGLKLTNSPQQEEFRENYIFFVYIVTKK